MNKLRLLFSLMVVLNTSVILADICCNDSWPSSDCFPANRGGGCGNLPIIQCPPDFDADCSAGQTMPMKPVGGPPDNWCETITQDGFHCDVWEDYVMCYYEHQCILFINALGQEQCVPMLGPGQNCGEHFVFQAVAEDCEDCDS